jgi:hypothetical protein
MNRMNHSMCSLDLQGRPYFFLTNTAIYGYRSVWPFMRSLVLATILNHL